MKQWCEGKMGLRYLNLATNSSDGREEAWGRWGFGVTVVV
jgi:hypothetical protein